MLHLAHKQHPFYQQALQLAAEVYRITETFPDSERAVLGYALRRHAVLLCQAIATGAVKKGKKQRQAYKDCLEFCVTLDAQMELALSVKSVTEEQTQKAAALLEAVYNSLLQLLRA